MIYFQTSKSNNKIYMFGFHQIMPIQERYKFHSSKNEIFFEKHISVKKEKLHNYLLQTDLV
jgi:hypothetical protein